MNKAYQEKFRSPFVIFSEISGVIVMLIGGLTLLGWFLGVPAMKSVFPGLVTMKVNTALCFILLGGALWFSQPERRNRIFSAAVRVLCFFVITIAGLTIVEYIYNINLGIDELFLKDDSGALLTIYPGRMPIGNSICFFLLSLALFASHTKKYRHYPFIQVQALIVTMLAVLSLMGYLYGIKVLYFGSRVFTAMALNSAIAFFMIGLGVFFLHVDQWLALAITSDNIGGRVARRLIPVALLVPPLLGWIKLWGERSGYLPHPFGVSFVAIMNMATIFYCIVWLVMFLNRADSERKNAELIRQASEQQLQAANQQLQAANQQLQAANQQLKASQQQLKASNQQLTANELKLNAEITERKKIEELNNKHIHELELFYKTSMGREERIIELKREVEELKVKLKK